MRRKRFIYMDVGPRFSTRPTSNKALPYSCRQSPCSGAKAHKEAPLQFCVLPVIIVASPAQVNHTERALLAGTIVRVAV